MTSTDARLAPDLPAHPVPSIVVWLVCAYMLCMPVADTMIRWSSAQTAGSELTADRSRFAVVNALTLTGFSYTIGPDTFSAFAQGVLILLTLWGSLFTMIVGGMAVIRILRLPYSDQQVISAAGFFTIVFTALGAIPLLASGRGTLESLLLSASAFGNGGVYVGVLPGAFSWETHFILLPLAFLGALGLPVLMELADVFRARRPLSVHGRTVLAVSFGLYLVCFLLFTLLRLSGEGTPPSWGQLAGSSSVASINARTLGMPFQFAQEFPRAMQWLLIPVMIVGGAAASTAGGLKVNTVAQLYLGTRKLLRHESAGRAFAVAGVWLAGYLLMLAVFFGLMLATVPQLDADRLFFETVSALSNVGLSYQMLNIVSPGLDVLSTAMVFGRLVPLGVLWWMAQTTRDADLAVG